MAYEEYVKKAIETGKRYDELPERVRASLSVGEWRARVREFCIQRGLPWNSSMARAACNEQEYYEELIKTYKAWARLYPYHLSDYIARVLRITPFRYYSDLLFLQLREEKSYDRIPNFTAADALRETGVGRNEYISIMNQCKAKRLMWRVNKGLARDLLPSVPKDVRMEPWWRVHVVNVGDAEFRELSQPEAALLRAACEPSGAPSSGSSTGSTTAPVVSAFDATLLQQLYKRGLVWLEVPVGADDRLSVPPLEGFVSNKTAEAGDESVDPFEPLLYNLFLANSSRLDQAKLADILGVELQQLLLATSLAIRLGFATKLAPGSAPGEEVPLGAGGGVGLGPPAPLYRGVSGISAASAVSMGQLLVEMDDDAASTATPRGAATSSVQWDNEYNIIDDDEDGGAIAVVVDAEATSYLMMGALSPGLKRHSVTLFEGGRVGGPAVMDELISELAASAEAGEHFEGDMVQLMRHIQSLGILLAVVRGAAAAQGQQLELLRKESLAGLDPIRAAKVLSHAYTAVIPIAGMPGPALPISPLAPSAPTLYGPTPEADSPWMHLVLYAAARCGPLSLVFVAGQRVWRLPAQLEGCSHALLWGWRVADGWAAGPLLVEGTSLLCTLNELLARTAVMVQPLVHMQQLPSTSHHASPLVQFIDVPLPLCPADHPAETAGAGTGTAAAAGSEGDWSSLAATSDLLGSEAAWDPFAATNSSSNAAAGTPRSPAAAAAAAGTLPSQQQQQQQVDGGISVMAVEYHKGAGRLQQQVVPAHIVAAIDKLQLRSAVGWLRMIKLPGPANPASGMQRFPAASHQTSSTRNWVPLSLHLGVPLFCPTLCRQVCSNMNAVASLTPGGGTTWRSAQAQLQRQLWTMMLQYGAMDPKSSKAQAVADLGLGLGGVVSNARTAAAAAAAGAASGATDGATDAGEVGPEAAAAAAAAADPRRTSSSGPLPKLHEPVLAHAGGSGPLPPLPPQQPAAGGSGSLLKLQPTAAAGVAGGGESSGQLLKEQQQQQQATSALGSLEAAVSFAGEAELPACGLLFDGCDLLPVDVSDCVQGVKVW